MFRLIDQLLGNLHGGKYVSVIQLVTKASSSTIHFHFNANPTFCLQAFCYGCGCVNNLVVVGQGFSSLPRVGLGIIILKKPTILYLEVNRMSSHLRDIDCIDMEPVESTKITLSRNRPMVNRRCYHNSEQQAILVGRSDNIFTGSAAQSSYGFWKHGHATSNLKVYNY
ncbi:hypothetical protein EGR_10038 [Echinococcus granulosus]|uniref:Uncharacterized protein n=1 Tax=Echinococcus granulosus TaxID=6210 RepID=W6U3G4_ECHGR|nr:hypothetical protein EGR_10038 [Echinococcus granulosus]EUB55101.1 hypothetical protein EGR_10038 [Echinococcus granulosus]